VTWKSNQALLKVEEEELTGIKHSKFACGGGGAKEGKMAFVPPSRPHLRESLLAGYKFTNQPSGKI